MVEHLLYTEVRAANRRKDGAAIPHKHRGRARGLLPKVAGVCSRWFPNRSPRRGTGGRETASFERGFWQGWISG